MRYFPDQGTAIAYAARWNWFYAERYHQQSSFRTSEVFSEKFSSSTRIGNRCSGIQLSVAPHSEVSAGVWGDAGVW